MTTNGNEPDSAPAQLSDPSAPRDLWELLPEETDKAFDAFVRYRDLADKRGLAAVAKELNCSVANVGRWAQRFRWKERALAYDAHLDEKNRKEMARDRIAMRKRQAEMGQAMQSVAAHALVELQRKIAEKLPLNLSTDEISRLADTGSKMERAARGEGTEGKYTQIIVNLGLAPDEPDPSAKTIDDSTGEVIQ